jgi:hypothetical protein
MRVDREKAIRMDFGGGTFVCGQHCAHAYELEHEGHSEPTKTPTMEAGARS